MPPISRRALCFRPPTPLVFSFMGVLVILRPHPPAAISVIFQLGWVPSGKNICAKKVLAIYFVAKDNISARK